MKRNNRLLLSCCLWALLLSGFTSTAAVEDPILGLTIQCTNLDLRVGDEIPIQFIITNEGKSPYTRADRTYDRSGRVNEYKLVATDEKGNKIVDPRANRPLGFMGGLYSKKILAPGNSFTNTISLNRWALINTPGRYEVAGTYSVFMKTGHFTSRPITIVVKPRSDAEMEAFIKDLHQKIKQGGQGPKHTAVTYRQELVQKLMFTCHPSIIPILLETCYADSGGYWEAEAFLYYLPRNEQTKQAIVETIRKRGFAPNMEWVLSQYYANMGGLTSEEMYPLIKRSLAPENPESWAGGALAAQHYANDDFTPRLIAIAKDPTSKARTQAIYALALNRTAHSVKALKAFLYDPDNNIRTTTTNAIRAAFQSRGNSQGRPLKQEDFDELF